MAETTGGGGGVVSLTAGQVLVKLGFETSSKSNKELKQFKTNVKEVSKTVEGTFSKLKDGIGGLDKHWKGIANNLKSIPGALQTIAQSTAFVGNIRNRELLESYKRFFREVKDYAVRTAKEVGEQLNLTSEDVMKHHMRISKLLPSVEFYGSKKRQADVGFQVLRDARALEAADPYNVSFEKMAPRIAKFLSGEGSAGDFINEMSRNLKDSVRAEKRLEWQKFTSSDFFKSQAGIRQRHALYNRIMKDVKPYDARAKDTNTALDRIEKTIKAIIEGIQNKLTGPIDRFVGFFDKVSDRLNANDGKIRKFIESFGATFTTITSIVGLLGGLRIALTLANKATFGIVPALTKLALKLGDKATFGIVPKITKLISSALTAAMGKALLIFAAKAAAVVAGIYFGYKYLKSEEFKKQFPTLHKLFEEGEKKTITGLDKATKVITTKKTPPLLGTPFTQKETPYTPGDPLRTGITRPAIPTPLHTPVPLRPPPKPTPQRDTLKQAFKMPDMGIGLKGGQQRPITINQNNPINIEVSGAEDPDMVAQKVAMTIRNEQKLNWYRALDTVGTGVAGNANLR